MDNENCELIYTISTLDLNKIQNGNIRYDKSNLSTICRRFIISEVEAVLELKIPN